MDEIEKAIYELYAAIDSDSMTEEPSNEAMELAITALRAQQERENGCEYCKRGIIGIHMEMKPSSVGNEQLNPNRAPWFCPMCGRRLKEAQEDGRA